MAAVSLSSTAGQRLALCVGQQEVQDRRGRRSAIAGIGVKIGPFAKTTRALGDPVAQPTFWASSQSGTLGLLTVDFHGSRVARSSGKRRNWGLWRGVGNFGMADPRDAAHYHQERRRI